MTLSAHPKSKLMKRFAALGPYLREEQCQSDRFFFDCLATCVNVKFTPEKRQFLGWWIELKPKGECFTYSYQLGLYTEGQWQAAKIKDSAVQEKLETTLRDFYKRLHELLTTMELTLEPAQDFNDHLINIPA